MVTTLLVAIGHLFPHVGPTCQHLSLPFFRLICWLLCVRCLWVISHSVLPRTAGGQGWWVVVVGGVGRWFWQVGFSVIKPSKTNGKPLQLGLANAGRWKLMDELPPCPHSRPPEIGSADGPARQSNQLHLIPSGDWFSYSLPHTCLHCFPAPIPFLYSCGPKVFTAQQNAGI